MGKRSRERRNRKREEKLRRKLQRQHRWTFGHDPHDPDAHPDSGWLYATLTDEPEPEPPYALWTPHGGPESGMPCPNCGEMTRVVDSHTPKEMLEPIGYEGTPNTKEKVVALGCPKCGRPVMQMRESALPVRRGG